MARADDLKARIGLGGPPLRPIHGEPPRVPDHELVRCIGQGGYGEVWLARNVVGTWRAVKVVYRDNFRDDHPYEREFGGIEKYEPLSRSNEGLVDVLQIGRNDARGYFYYVMELADDLNAECGVRSAGSAGAAGSIPQSAFRTPHLYTPRTLSAELRRSGRLAFDECLQLGLTLNLALGHLHRHGLIHRDVKPSNVIFVNGVPKLADIGLVTGIGEANTFVGTEGFVPPEGPNSTQADLYALGKVLYEASMGKDRQEFPEPFSRLALDAESKALMELNAILLKACATNAQDRYQSAEEMNADLALLHSGKSVVQHHATERRLAKLKRLSLVGGMVTLIAAAAYFWQSYETRQMKQLAADNLRLARESRQAATESRARLTQLQVGNATSVMDQGDLLRSLLWLVEAFKTVAGDPAREAMHRVRIASVLEHCPKLAHVFPHEAPVERALFSPDGLRLATLTSSETSSRISVFDLATGKPIFSLSRSNEVDLVAELVSGRGLFSFSSGGRSLLVPWRAERQFSVLGVPSGKSLIPAEMEKRASAVSPDGQWLFVITETNKSLFNRWQLFTARTGQPIGEEIRAEDSLYFHGYRFSTDGRRLMVGSEKRGWNGVNYDVWDVPSRQHVGKTIAVTGTIFVTAVLSPDGTQVLSGKLVVGVNTLTDVQLWNVADGRSVAAFKPESACHYVAFSPNGRWVLTAGSSANGWNVRAWDASSGLPVGLPLRHADAPEHLAVSPDGLLVATAGRDGFTHLWNPIKGELVGVPLRSGGIVNGVEFSPDGRFLATASDDHQVRVWDLAGLHRPERVLKLTDRANHVAFSPDGRRLIASSQRVRLWDVQRGTPQPGGFDPAYRVGESRLTPDGLLAVSFAGPRYLSQGVNFPGAYVWDTQTAQLVCPPLATNGSSVTYAEFSPDGRRLVTAAGRSARVWEAGSGQPLTPELTHGNRVNCALFSPDGRRVVTASTDRTAQLWDATTGQKLLPPFKHNAPVLLAQFSRDGVLLVTTAADQSVRVWDSVTGSPRSPTLIQPGSGYHAVFSPDGQSLLTAGSAPEARLWRLGQPSDPLAAVLAHGDRTISTAAFSPNGNFALTTSWDGTARVWDASNGEALTPLLRHDGAINHGAFSPVDSHLFATADNDKTVRLWRLNRWLHSAETLADLAQVLYGQKLGPGGSLSVVPAREVASRFGLLRSIHPELFSNTPTDVLAWHREMAEYAARCDQWPTVIWHLSIVLSAEPKDADALALRGTAYAELAQWPAARRDFQAALDLDRHDPDHWENLADVFLATQDLPNYHNLCAEALVYAKSESDPYLVHNLADLGGVIPGAFADQGLAVKLIETAVAARPANPFYARSHGIALYRAGRFQEAIAELERQRHLPPLNAPDLLGMTFLTLARQQVGKTAEARALWQDVTRISQNWTEKKVSENGPTWAARTALALLRKEAETVLNEASH